MMPINKSSSVNDSERWAMSEAESVPLKVSPHEIVRGSQKKLASAACACYYWLSQHYSPWFLLYCRHIHPTLCCMKFRRKMKCFPLSICLFINEVNSTTSFVSQKNLPERRWWKEGFYAKPRAQCYCTLASLNDRRHTKLVPCSWMVETVMTTWKKLEGLPVLLLGKTTTTQNGPCHSSTETPSPSASTTKKAGCDHSWAAHLCGIGCSLCRGFVDRHGALF